MPTSIMAVPLVNGETTLGVLQVLDRARPTGPRPRRDRSPDPVREPGLDRARPVADGPARARRRRARRGARGGRRPARGAARARGGRRGGATPARGARGRARPTRPLGKRSARTPTRRPRRLSNPIRWRAELRPSFETPPRRRARGSVVEPLEVRVTRIARVLVESAWDARGSSSGELVSCHGDPRSQRVVGSSFALTLSSPDLVAHVDSPLTSGMPGRALAVYDAVAR